jgi:hypothetical protein
MWKLGSERNEEEALGSQCLLWGYTSSDLTSFH